MNPLKRFQDQVERGRQAEELLNHPILKESFEKIENYLRADWEITKGPDAERREDIWRTLKLLENIQGHIRYVATTGKNANKEILKLK